MKLIKERLTYDPKMELRHFDLMRFTTELVVREFELRKHKEN